MTERHAHKLTGSQQLVMSDARDGLVWRGKHNGTCKELARMGLLKFEQQPSPYGADHPRQPAWRVLGESRDAAKGETR